ncbi:MAG: nicotinate-nucleotide adenylyltransferase [Candidatus Latescibacterota bacterium]
MNKTKIGIFGGTFDPIHLGHLITAQEVLTTCSLEKVIFVPSADPPHKESRRLTHAEDRLKMVSLAIARDSRFEVSAIELERPGKSYTVDTLRQMGTSFGAKVGLCFIIGADNVPEIRTWKQPEVIFDLAEVIVATRPGFEPHSMDEPFVERMTFVSTPEIALSSTEIRRRVKRGWPIGYWVSEAVVQYIADNRLYV